MQIGAFGRGRVRARAFEQNQLRATMIAQHLYRLGDVGHGRNAGAHDDGFTGLRHLFQQNMVGVFKRSDLVDRHLQRLQKVNGGSIEWRTEGHHTMLFCPLKDSGMPLPGRVGILIKFVQIFIGPKRLVVPNKELVRLTIKGNRIGRVGLEFQGMSTRRRRRIHQFQRPAKRLIMISRHFGNDKRPVLRGDGVLGNLNGRK